MILDQHQHSSRFRIGERDPEVPSRFGHHHSQWKLPDHLTLDEGILGDAAQYFQRRRHAAHLISPSRISDRNRRIPLGHGLHDRCHSPHRSGDGASGDHAGNQQDQDDPAGYHDDPPPGDKLGPNRLHITCINSLRQHLRGAGQSLRHRLIRRLHRATHEFVQPGRLRHHLLRCVPDTVTQGAHHFGVGDCCGRQTRVLQH